MNLSLFHKIHAIHRLVGPLVSVVIRMVTQSAPVYRIM